jgi:hypothetical protein
MDVCCACNVTGCEPITAGSQQADSSKGIVKQLKRMFVMSPPYVAALLTALSRDVIVCFLFPNASCQKQIWPREALK